MGFFTDVLPDRVPGTPETQHVLPARQGPPEGWVLPTVLPTVRELGRSTNARIALVALRCWPDGVSFDVRLMVRTRDPNAPEFDWSFRLGARFADQRCVAFQFPPRQPNFADGLVLRPNGGGGGPFHRHWDFYLWPLPPRGRLTLVTDWPTEDVPETYTELDAGEIRAAAARAVVVWRDLPSNPSSGGDG